MSTNDQFHDHELPSASAARSSDEIPRDASGISTAALEHCRPALPFNEKIASILATLMSVLLAIGNNVICELHSVSLPLVMIERGFE